MHTNEDRFLDYDLHDIDYVIRAKMFLNYMNGNYLIGGLSTVTTKDSVVLAVTPSASCITLEFPWAGVG
jgi:hypothetical protein